MLTSIKAVRSPTHYILNYGLNPKTHHSYAYMESMIASILKRDFTFEEKIEFFSSIASSYPFDHISRMMELIKDFIGSSSDCTGTAFRLVSVIMGSTNLTYKNAVKILLRMAKFYPYEFVFNIPKEQVNRMSLENIPHPFGIVCMLIIKICKRPDFTFDQRRCIFLEITRVFPGIVEQCIVPYLKAYVSKGNRKHMWELFDKVIYGDVGAK